MLQNSWQSLPFFEVDEEYWYASEAKVRFVVTRQNSIQPCFDANDLKVAESGIIGVGVAEPEPMG